MPFYRLAEEQDFIIEEKYVEFLLKHNQKVIDLIKNGKTLHAVKELRQTTGMSIQDSKRLCDRYKSCLKAQEDFKNGKKIYTEY